MDRSRGETGNAEGTGPWNASTDFLLQMRPNRVNEAQCRAGDAMPTHQLREVHRHILVGEGHIRLDLGGEAVPEGGVAVHIHIHGSPKGTGRLLCGDVPGTTLCAVRNK